MLVKNKFKRASQTIVDSKVRTLCELFLLLSTTLNPEGCMKIISIEAGLDRSDLRISLSSFGAFSKA